MSKHPIQPVELDSHGVARFKGNAIVRFLLDNGGYDMNRLHLVGFSDEDWNQFNQLIGYSVSGFGDINNSDPGIVAVADAEVRKILGEKVGDESMRLHRLIDERDATNQAAHKLAREMDWRDIADIDKALAVAVLTSRDKIPFREAYAMVFSEPIEIGDKFVVRVPDSAGHSVWEVIDDHGMVPDEKGIERHEFEAKCLSGSFEGSTNSFPEGDILAYRVAQPSIW